MSKLRFHVVNYTSEELDYPAEELNSHGPNTKGWQSAKFASFPQEIGIELDSGECRLSQIQILSHQSKISSKVEIFIGSGGSYQDASFKRLGYLSLDTNEKSNYQARELKTVYIDNMGRYIKLLVHKNYLNQFNYFNQVGIVAVNLIGVESKGNDVSRRAMPTITSNPINDLALDMNLDPQTTAKLRQLSEAKTRAVASEDYVTAKKIKCVEHDLKELGARLAQLEIAKRKAVEAEDYDRAKDLKDECDAMRDEIEFKISGIKIPGVTDVRTHNVRGAGTVERKGSASRHIEADPIVYHNTSESKDPYPDITPTKPRKTSSVAAEPVYDDIATHYPDDFDGPMEDRPIRPKDQLSYNDPDPMIGEDQSMMQGEQFEEGEHPLDGVENYAALPPPEDLTGKSKEISDQGISSLIGEYRARCLMSRVWGLRAAALNKTILMLSDFEESPGISNCFSALMAIIRVGVEDKMQQVFHEALVLLEAVLDVSKPLKLARTIVAPCVDPIIVNLIDKLYDTNIRIKEGAKRGLDLLMHAPVVVGPTYLASHALKPLNSKQLANWRIIVARLRLLVDIVTDFGLGPNVGLSADSVMNFCKNLSAFAHANGEVRDAAKDLTTAVQKLVGTSAIDSYIADLRPKQKEEYYAAFGEAVPENQAATGSKPNASKNPSTTAAKAAATSPKANQKPGGGQASKPAAAGKSPVKDTPSTPTNHASSPAAAGAPQNFTVCMFCGASDKSWNEDALDLHFWKSCPLLTPCPACAQVVEIAGLPEHLLDECEHKNDYVPCDTTGLAIRKVDFATWQRSKNCKPPPDNCIFCPLCLSSVEDSDEAWKQHLVRGCPKNARTQS